MELTLQSMTRQTIKPAQWVIVDDGSVDGTTRIVDQYATQYPFIKLVHHPRAGARRPGSPVIRAFDFGRTFLPRSGYDFIVKLDCDLSFGSDYFEQLLSRFLSDPELGIASGVYLEADNVGAWRQVPMPKYHAFGACKVLRRACFEEIRGFPAAAGWDTVDEIRAMARGWTTRHFADLQVKHHKREGSGIGQLKTNRMLGEIYYATGGDPLFLAFKIAHRAAVAPYVVGSVALALGYFNALIRRRPRLVSTTEAASYRRLLRRRLLSGVRAPFRVRTLRTGPEGG